MALYQWLWGNKLPHHVGPSGNTAYMSHQQINKMTCAPSTDSDQPGHLPILLVLSYAGLVMVKTFKSAGRLPSNLLAQLLERPACDWKVVGSIPDRVLPKTFKMVLAPLSLCSALRKLNWSLRCQHNVNG